MSNSPMASYVKISPNRTAPRRDQIRKITIHHVAGNLSIEAIGNLFASGAREASANYGVGTDGRVAMYVEEKDRAWTSSSPSNDNQAITIEVANDGGEPNWHVSDKALETTITLCVDICKRNGIKRLVYTGDATGNLTRHNMFAATACPGPYLQSKFPYIAEEVNKRLNISPSLYRVRKTWEDSKTQIGAFAVLENAMRAAKQADGYKVFDQNGAVVYAPSVEITVENALADGIITDRAHWLGVLSGTITPNPEYIKDVMDNAHEKIKESGLTS